MKLPAPPPDKAAHFLYGAATARKQGLRFDATINAGHLLTFAGFCVAGFLAWETIAQALAGSPADGA